MIEKIDRSGKSFGIKLLVLIGILVGCAFVGTFLLLAMAMAGGMDIQSGFDIFGAIGDEGMKPFIKTGIGLNHFVMFTISAIAFAYFIKSRAWMSYFDWKEVDSDLLLKFVLLLFLSYPLIGLSAMAFEGIDLPEWMDSMDEESIESLMAMLQMDGYLDLFVNIIIIALLPAIGEELLFRGVIQKELTKVISNPHVAILIASIIFSGFHIQIQGFLPKLIIGLILGYAYYWTKSIWYPMALHFINNGLQTLILFFAGDAIEGAQEEAVKPEMSILIIVVGISCFLCYLLVNKIRDHISQPKIENV